MSRRKTSSARLATRVLISTMLRLWTFIATATILVGVVAPSLCSHLSELSANQHKPYPTSSESMIGNLQRHTTNEHDETSREQTAQHTGSDRLHRKQTGELRERSSRRTRAATARLDRLWDEAVIPYEIDPIFSGERANLFRAAMRHWENNTCIKFVERQPDEHRNYIVFTERSCGCCSFVGKRGNGAQAISIGRHCDKFGIVVHELGHVVGFWHEHTRPDRDQHVQIIGKNIMSGQEYNFNKLTKDEVDSLGLAYDYDSILHYATNTFAKDTYLDTILPLHAHLNTEVVTSEPFRVNQMDAQQQLINSNSLQNHLSHVGQQNNNKNSSPTTATTTTTSSTSTSSSISTSTSFQINQLVNNNNNFSSASSRTSSSAPNNNTMINDPSAAGLSFARLEKDFKSMLEFDYDASITSGSRKHKRSLSTQRDQLDDGQHQLRLMSIDGNLVLTFKSNFTTTQREAINNNRHNNKAGQAAIKTDSRDTVRLIKRRNVDEQEQREAANLNHRIDFDDGLHMLAMDNLLQKSRPEIGQRVRMSVGDIAQTNLLYKCPKCGRTIQQSSGIFHSPNYNQFYHHHSTSTSVSYTTTSLPIKRSKSNNNISNNNKLQTNLPPSFSEHNATPGSSAGSNPSETHSTRDSFCEWRLSVGLGERIMLNISDFDIAGPAESQSHLPSSSQDTPNIRLGLPRSAYSPDLMIDENNMPLGYSYGQQQDHRYSANNPLIMLGCNSDYLEIRDGYTYRSPLVAKLCGHIATFKQFLRPIVSTSNRFLVSYKHSTASLNKRGFLIRHEAVCGGVILLDNDVPQHQHNKQQLNQYHKIPTIISNNNLGQLQVGGASITSEYGQPGYQFVPNVLIQQPSVIIGGENIKQLVNNNNNNQHSNMSKSESDEMINSSNTNNNSNLRAYQTNQNQYHLQSNIVDFRDANPNINMNNNNDSPNQPINNQQPTSVQKTNVDQQQGPSSQVPAWFNWPRITNSNTIQSPNWPETYKPNRECVWLVKASENYQISLRFESFDLEGWDHCAYDYVEVRDGSSGLGQDQSLLPSGGSNENNVAGLTQDSPLLGKFCGNKAPELLLSSGSSLMVKFVSDSDINKTGFMATFKAELDECKLGTHGCSYKCSNAAIPYRCECPIGWELAADGKNCLPMCGGIRTEDSGQIMSPNYPDQYPVSTKCIWDIIAPAHHLIFINFTHFDLEGVKAQECDYDYVIVRSRSSNNYKLDLGGNNFAKNHTYCGQIQHPFNVTSIGNSLRIEFNSDNSIQKSGFIANYSFDLNECALNNKTCEHICTNTIGSYQCSCNNGFLLHENKHDCIEGHCLHSILEPEGTFHSPNFPNHYQPNKECAWLFSTAPGHRKKLIFDQFDLESHQQCTYDHIAIYDGQSADDLLLYRFCGSRKPLTIISSFNMLYMLFKSDATNERRGFNGTHTTVCGGRLPANLNQNDLIFSHPTFDGVKNYGRNEDCEWLIEAYNQRVQIEFNFFALEPDNNCNLDYVQLFDGKDDAAPSLARLCGTELNKNQTKWISSGDTMMIVFRTDDSINHSGFSITYTAIEPN